MTDYIRTDAMPIVTTPAAETHSVTIIRVGEYGLTSRRRVIVDTIDRDDLAAFIRGAIADAYHAGRRDALAEAWRADTLTEMTTP
jgi:hypothetical protein